MHGLEIVVVCGIVVAGFGCQWIAWRCKVPSILFLLFVGIMVGPVLQWLDPDELLGDLLKPLVSVAVAVILFEGSLTLKLRELGGQGAVVKRLVTLGVLISLLFGALSAWWLLGWDLSLAILFGAIVTVSGPTVVVPLLRAVNLSQPLANILRWEGILIDAIGAILALLVFDYIIAAHAAAGLIQVLQTMLAIIGAGVTLGICGGYGFGVALRRQLVPDYLRDFAALAAMLLVFAAAEALQAEAGLLAVTLMGVWLANMRNVELEDVLSFKESLTLMLVSGLFIILAARLSLDGLSALGLGALVIFLVLQFVAGPVRALVCSWGSDLSWRERLFLGWIFPRGIVAAAISALFALRLEEQGFANADKLVPLVFTLILGTVVIQSLTARPLARRLKIADPDPTGVLVVGANPLALHFARALQDAGVRVLVADSHWESTAAARMMGLSVFYGNAVSRYAEHHLDSAGLGCLLALSRRPGLNELACVRYAHEFGRDRVFLLGTGEETAHAKHRISGQSRGRVILGGESTLDELLERIDAGWEIKTTQLTPEFGLEDYRQTLGDSVVLFAIDPQLRVHFPQADAPLEAGEGWTVGALTVTGETTQ